jgi:hypothetical protein
MALKADGYAHCGASSAPSPSKKGGNNSASSGFSTGSVTVASGSKRRARWSSGESVMARHVLLTRGATVRRSRMGSWARVCSRSSGVDITVSLAVAMMVRQGGVKGCESVASDL